jgi:hypothetical protein
MSIPADIDAHQHRAGESRVTNCEVTASWRQAHQRPARLLAAPAVENNFPLSAVAPYRYCGGAQ